MYFKQRSQFSKSLGVCFPFPFPQFLIVPAIVGSALLHGLSDDCWEKITAWIYGMGLCALFIISTVFHIVSWKKSHLRYSGLHTVSTEKNGRLRLASHVACFGQVMQGADTFLLIVDSI